MPTRDREKSQLLAEDQYDDDAADVDNDLQQGTVDDDNSEDDTLDGRTSREIADTDREVFDDDYEHNGLLDRKQGRNSRGLREYLRGEARKLGADAEQSSSRGSGRSTPLNVKRSRRRKKLEGSSEMMFEMEEGGRLTGSSDEGDLKERQSSEEDLQRLGDIRKQASKSRRRRRLRRIGLYLAIVVAFILMLFAAYGASRRTGSVTNVAQRIVSNGSALFPPTTILLSLDGFRADFLQRDITPNMKAFIESGISPQWMLPSFPSVTFPNHYTMVTGLYPEAHGIVGNTFWDPTFGEEFYYTHTDVSMQPKWWGGQPLWVTAEKQGVRTAIHMWPGSEAHIGGVDISHVDKYNSTETLERKVRKILEYLDLPGQEHETFATLDNGQQRPQLIAAYVPVVDEQGHMFGPNSTEIRKTIADVDNMLADMLKGLKERNLTDIVNVVIVSDHGMATTDVTRLIQLEDLVDTDKIEHIDGWPLYGLRPRSGVETLDLYKQLKETTRDNPNVEVYLRDVDMPKRYHFSDNERIAPLWVVPKAGWAIVKKDEFNIQDALTSGAVYHPRGLHGYDHEHPLMRAIFAAKGPAFRHKPNSRMEIFQNTEVYNIVCDSLGIKAAPNNGTLRLPLKPVGLHSDSSVSKPQLPDDPPVHTPTSTVTASLNTVTQTPVQTSASVSLSASNTATDIVWSTTLEWSSQQTGKPDADDEHSWKDEAKHKVSKWWQWVKDKYHGAKDWVTGMVKGMHKVPEDAESSKGST